MLICTIYSKLASDNRKRNQNEIQLFKAYLASYFVKMFLHFALLYQSIVKPNYILPCIEAPSLARLTTKVKVKKTC